MLHTLKLTLEFTIALILVFIIALDSFAHILWWTHFLVFHFLLKILLLILPVILQCNDLLVVLYLVHLVILDIGWIQVTVFLLKSDPDIQIAIKLTFILGSRFLIHYLNDFLFFLPRLLNIQILFHCFILHAIAIMIKEMSILLMDCIIVLRHLCALIYWVHALHFGRLV